MELLHLIIIHLLNQFHVHHTAAEESILGPAEHESGYVEVRPGAHMFWLLYFTTNSQVSSPYEKPLVIWLQGGPGDSSVGFGNFAEIGPLDMELKQRKHSWVEQCNVLFIDSPVGTGFSYVDSNETLSRSNTQIAEDLLSLMKSFLDLKQEFRKVPAYIFAESYGGKMAAEFALVWSQNQTSIESNLKGLALGGAWISPIDTMTSWIPYLSERSSQSNNISKFLIGSKQRKAAEGKIKDGIKAMSEKLWLDAFEFMCEAIVLAVSSSQGLDVYNIKDKNEGNTGDPESLIFSTRQDLRATDLETLMQKETLREQLKINDKVSYVAQSNIVYLALCEDFMKPAIESVERLLNETNLKIFIYTGNLDFIANDLGAYEWTKKLSWKYTKEWQSSQKKPFPDDGKIMAYQKQYDKLSFFWILNAGHMAPLDNPKAMIQILKHMVDV